MHASLWDQKNMERDGDFLLEELPEDVAEFCEFCRIRKPPNISNSEQTFPNVSC
jgi:hypothetical protein